MGQDALGNDTVSSIYLKPGTTVALYSDYRGEGICETFTASDVNLADNMIGDNRLSSVWPGHRCEQDVQLCEHSDLRGRCVSLRSEKPSLRLTDIGNDAASSVRVPDGWEITVFSDDHFEGWRDPLTGPVTRSFGPGSTMVPNDSASSIKFSVWPTSKSGSCSGFGCLNQ